MTEGSSEMMSKLWKKGDFFATGPNDKNRKDMDASVVQLPDNDEALPLFWHFDYSSGPIGEVKNFRLEDGEIVCDTTLHESPHINYVLDETDVRLGGHYINVEMDDSRKIVTSCTLKSVSLVPNINMPGSLKND